MVEVSIEGDITHGQARAVRDAIAGKYGRVAKVSLASQTPLAEPADLPAELVGVAGAVAALISACVNVWTAYRIARDSRASTPKRFRALVEQEMLALGATDWRIERLQNYRALLERGSGPCVTTVRDARTGERYKLYMLRGGKVYVLRIEAA